MFGGRTIRLGSGRSEAAIPALEEAQRIQMPESPRARVAISRETGKPLLPCGTSR